jgi:hypothetical protein
VVAVVQPPRPEAPSDLARLNTGVVSLSHTPCMDVSVLLLYLGVPE